MENLNYSTSWINRNFLLKVYGVDADGVKVNRLVGVSGLLSLIGATLFNKFIERALRAGDDVCVCKLRRGLQVSLYNK